jgi:glucosamine kinase
LTSTLVTASLPDPNALPLWPRGALFLVGVDGGGSGTRARLQDRQGHTLGEGAAGPSGLGQGVAQAWRHVEQAIAVAFGSAGLALPAPDQIALGLGLAGASVAEQRAAFLAVDPGYAACVLDTDAVTQLIGAHGGRPGLVVAAGTGSVAAARYADGRVRLAGGWGFPVGDEGSGAWLGLRAMQHAQTVLDGRASAGWLSAAVLAASGPEPAAVQAWCAHAGQHAYAQLAPLVFAAAAQADAFAEALLQQAAAELALLVPALQSGESSGLLLPIVMRGSVGESLAARWPDTLRARLVPPRGDSADGALQLLRAALADDAAAVVRPGGTTR